MGEKKLNVEGVAFIFWAIVLKMGNFKFLSKRTNVNLNITYNIISLNSLMSTESKPSVLMFLPLKTTVLNPMEPKEQDSRTVREVKAAIRENLENRYSACTDVLHKCTALGPMV